MFKKRSLDNMSYYAGGILCSTRLGGSGGYLLIITHLIFCRKVILSIFVFTRNLEILRIWHDEKNEYEVSYKLNYTIILQWIYLKWIKNK